MSRNARSLAGRTIVVTRPQRQAAVLVEMIEEAGGHAFRFPLIEIEPATSRALDSTIDGLDSFDLAVFISRNAVEQGLERVRTRQAWPRQIRTAAIGGGTRRALEAHGIENVLSPEGPADSEALLKHPGMAAVSGKRVVIFRGEGGREFLGNELRSRGASVTYAECYRRTIPVADARPLLAGLADGVLHAVVVSSGEGLANLARLLGEGAGALLGGATLFVPHRGLVKDAQTLGIPQPVVAGPADADMLAALVAYFCRAG